MTRYNIEDKFRKNKRFQEFYLKLTNDNNLEDRNKGYNFVAALRHYLRFRKISIGKLIIDAMDNPENELKQMELFLIDDSIKISRNSKLAHLRRIKRFLRDCGAEFPRFAKKRKLYFSKDPMMLKHLETDVGQSWSNKKQVNRAINHFIEFTNKKTNGQIQTPTDCITEVKSNNFSLEQLRDSLIEFYNWRRKQTNLSSKSDKKIDDVTAWKQMMMVKLFIEYRAFVSIKIPNNRKPKKMLNRSLPMGLSSTAKLVDVPTMRKMLKVADLRSSAALMIAFESGANPVDILQLQVKHFEFIKNGKKKSYLNIDEPYVIPKDEIIFIKLERSKTSREFYLALSGQSLQLISLLLRARMDGKFGFPDNIAGDTYIITQLGTPYMSLKGKSLNHLFRKTSELAGFDVDYLPSDFRNSFITRVKTFNLYGEIVKSILVGHSLGLGRNYEIVIDSENKLIGSSENVINLFDEYKNRWNVLFNLEYQSKEIAEQKLYFEHQMDMVHEQNKKLLKENKVIKSEISELLEDKQEFDDRFERIFRELYFLKEKTQNSDFEKESEWKAKMEEKIKQKHQIDDKGGFEKLSKAELIDFLKETLDY